VENGEIIGRGSSQHPEFLVSDLAAADFRFTAQFRLVGVKAVAEIALRGSEREGRFEGTSLSFGGSSPATIWKYRGTAAPESSATAAIAPGEWMQCEIVARAGIVNVMLNNQPVATITDSPGGARSVLAFYVYGESSELRIKGPKLELLEKQP
jgi:hypothetical protein